MNTEARALDQHVRDWWLDGAADFRLSAILDLALTTEPVSLVPLARALFILEQAELGPALTERVKTLHNALSPLIERARQIDSLGDLDNEPESLFVVLGDETQAVAGFDSDRLRKARLSYQGSRASAAEAFLEAVGWEAFSSKTTHGLKLAIAELKERERFEAWGLFVESKRTEGVALGIKFVIREGGKEVIESAASETHQQARIVASHLLKGSPWETSIEWPANFAGESIGLPLSIAALTALGAISRDALLASTGRLDISGNVLGVTGIRAKVEAAQRLGMRRVIVPKENSDEAIAAANGTLAIIAIGHIQELTAALRQPVSAVDFDIAALNRLVRASSRDYGLIVMEEQEYPHGRCFVMGNTAGKIRMWVYANGRVMPQGGAGKNLDAAQRLIRERIPTDPETRPSHSFDLVTAGFEEKARAVLEQIGACHEPPHQHERWRLRLRRGRSTATIVAYSSGKCVLQGAAPAWQAAFDTLNEALAPIGGLSTPDVRSEEGSTISSCADPAEPHIGTDEAGKGDYFGPLVCAAVYVDQQLTSQLRDLGVRDSKMLSDRRVSELADAIKVVAEGKYAITPINPPKFNELYGQFSKERKNLNSLLAWGHAKSIDRLISAPANRGIKPRYVLVDQFADARHVEERTRRAGIPIHQRPKAEDDIAVAAASILARDSFLAWLAKWSERTAIKLPKGASPQVIDAGKQFIRRWGRASLGDVAKLNFRTTLQVVEGEDENVSDSTPPWASDREVTREG
jgi:ribonuclease HIII